MDSSFLVFRLRVLLRFTRAARLHAQQAAELYALLSRAYGLARQQSPALPDGLMVEAPEQCRIHYSAGTEFAFGCTLIAASPVEAVIVVKLLVEGLQAVGADTSVKHLALGGNFKVAAVADLIAGRETDLATPLVPLPTQHIAQEVARLRGLTELTVRFTSPLRCSRPKHARAEGHAFFDRNWFDPGLFVRRVCLRQMRLCGEEINPVEHEVPTLALLDNRVVWIDLTYGPDEERKALGGVMGRVRFAVPRASNDSAEVAVTVGCVESSERTSPASNNPTQPDDLRCVPKTSHTLREDATPDAPFDDLESLVWGQYLGVGESTRFGFGRYRIEELGPDPFPCPRAASLVALALPAVALDRAAAEFDLEPGELSARARSIHEGTYTPSTPHRFTLTTSGKSRELCVPAPVDRALQRCVCDLIAPALDLFFEESSLAYRKGLGRHRAARRIERAFRDGFAWAVKADIHDFYNSIDHVELRARLEAYVHDPALSDLILRWVEHGAPTPGRGLPTGAVLSPLLGNLLLDQFDEQIEAEGARLVRYADDFLILFRDRADADRMFRAAQDAAAELHLQLNEHKTALIDLGSSFEFLGFRFQQATRWEPQPTGQPRPLDELGWCETASQRGLTREQIVLPGETDGPAYSPDSTVILGPGIQWLGYGEGKLKSSVWKGGESAKSISLERVSDVIVIGSPTIARELIFAANEHDLTISVMNASGRTLSVLRGETLHPSAELLRAQVAAFEDSARRLTVARGLVAAKIANHATLARSVPARGGDSLADDLQALVSRAEAVASIPELLGVEGTAARLWYGRLSKRLPIEFPFSKRVAPQADDPVNALLNLGQTVLNRMMTRVLTQAGFVPTLGLLHEVRSGHAALASDLQEPFRHLVDRVVIAALRELDPRDFRRDQDGPFPLRIQPRAIRRFLELLHWSLAKGCICEPGGDAVPYRVLMARQARALKRHLLDPTQPLTFFRHPETKS